MTDLLALLRKALNDPVAQFRPGQEEAILAAVRPPFRALIVQATGWGKSMVYFIATRILRDAGRGPTLVISPLLSLMRDQLKAAERLGLRAEQYTSDNRDDWDLIDAKLRANQVDLLLVSPERLANEEFRSLVGTSSLANVGLIVIDEAHCISDWGHDFRPDYQRIGELIRKLPLTTAVLATTATANSRVVEDVQRQIGEDVAILRGPLARKSLRLQVIAGSDAAQRLAWLADHLNNLPGSGIIYALTQHDTERVAEWLQQNGYDVEPYHAGLPADRKVQLEERLIRNELRALVATVALGMGFDKPDLGFVIHYQSPGNLVAYYQQIGRAGRAIDEAVAILFLGREDNNIHDWFIQGARPKEAEIASVLEALEEGSLSTVKLAERLNLNGKEIEKVLKTISILPAAPVVKVGSQYQRTPTVYVHDHAREAALNARRSQERQSLVQFAGATDCLMMRVRLELDDPTAEPCGRCANCVGAEIVAATVEDSTLAKAMTFLRRSEFPITPRRKWFGDALAGYDFAKGRGGSIPEELQCLEGICLSKWGDPATAQWVKEDKEKGHFRDALIDVAVEAINGAQDLPRLDWVCSIPSTRSGNIVPDFAKRLANALQLPYVEAVKKVRDTGPQKDQRNNFHQAKNLDLAFEVTTTLPGNVLLVDDMVDSKWTFTVVGALLRRSGVESVTPLALSSTHNRGEDE